MDAINKCICMIIVLLFDCGSSEYYEGSDYVYKNTSMTSVTRTRRSNKRKYPSSPKILGPTITIDSDPDESAKKPFDDSDKTSIVTLYDSDESPDVTILEPSTHIGDSGCISDTDENHISPPMINPTDDEHTPLAVSVNNLKPDSIDLKNINGEANFNKNKGKCMLNKLQRHKNISLEEDDSLEPTVNINHVNKENISKSNELLTPTFNHTSIPKPSIGGKIKKHIDINDPIFKLPFQYGWKREIVFGKKNGANVYYYSPNNQKLQNLLGIQKQLDLTVSYNNMLTIDNFTFYGRPLGSEDRSKERIRHAHIKLSKEDSWYKNK